MKSLFLTGILTVAAAGVGVQGAWPSGSAAPPLIQSQSTAQETEKQPPTKASAGQKAAAGNNLGSVRLPRRVTANGQPLAAGTYQLRLTEETAKPAPGQTPESERWVEFLQGGQVRGRELASVVPDTEIAQVAEGPGKPARNGHRVDLLKAQKYWRVWVNRGGNNYLIHLPPADGPAKTGKAGQ